ncbi:olfactory receptor 4F15-like [Grammomys surdaster]|uniref:olfactory receptor 4F15-like n=1 Tax=Grammomys surdaster TaxID=491861 RepID=UPI00109F8C2A|nr:olfactory receptor 4F15-like [Grammomys surdaster]
MVKKNYTEVSEFVFLGLSTSRKIQPFLLGFSMVFYVAIVLGNSLVMFTLAFDPHLHSPMYFLLGNLALIDLCLSTLTIPKMISDLSPRPWLPTIPSQMPRGHEGQISGRHNPGMRWDRYVAICKPLHYLTIMSRRMCLMLLSGAWVIGFLHSVAQLAFIIKLRFCGPNEIDSFYCDLPQFIKLACIDPKKMQFMVTANSGFISTGTFFLLIISYIVILFIVRKHSSSGDLSKALSTLSAHISVVVLFFGPCIFVYMWPFPTVPLDKFLAILDFMITPILNPAIYTLRNKDMKVAMRRLITQLLGLRKSL